MSKIYLEDKEVIKYEPAGDRKSPLGEPVVRVHLKGGDVKEMTTMRFQATKSEKQSDASAARAQLLKAVSEKFYAIAIEYGLRVSELDALINDFIKLTNDSQAKANCILWGIETEFERDLLQVNDVLMDKYGPQSTEETKGSDEPSA
jgi:hypothetical protein